MSISAIMHVLSKLQIMIISVHKKLIKNIVPQCFLEVKEPSWYLFNIKILIRRSSRSVFMLIARADYLPHKFISFLSSLSWIINAVTINDGKLNLWWCHFVHFCLCHPLQAPSRVIRKGSTSWRGCWMLWSRWVTCYYVFFVTFIIIRLL